jgi:hypothetical protein
MMARVTRIALLLVLAMLSSCGGDVSDPEEQVRAWVRAMHEAAEEKERGDIVAGISPAYIDARGNSRDDIDKLLRLYFFRQNTITLLGNIDDVKVIGGTAAEVSITVGMAGTNNSALGISADAYRFELELELDGDDWLLISARWGELGEQLR